MISLTAPCPFCHRVEWCGEGWCRESGRIELRERSGGAGDEGSVSVLQSVASEGGVLSGTGPGESGVQHGGSEGGGGEGPHSAYKDVEKRREYKRAYQREYMRRYRERKKERDGVHENG